MSELLFSAMDIPNEVKKILDDKAEVICEGMTDSEREAYDFGVSTVLSLLRGLLEADEEVAVHMSGLEEMQEMDIAELEERFLN